MEVLLPGRTAPLPHFPRVQQALAGLAALIAAQAAGASGLSVSPVGLDFSPQEPAKALWLSNVGDAPLRAQLRAYRWSQPEGKDQLTPTRDLVLSPPILQLAPGQQQLVRVIRRGAAAAGEQSYRILVDELPETAAKPRQGLSFVMQFSIPVFAGAARADPAAAPVLEWRLAQHDGMTVLVAHNSGTRRAQVSNFELLDRAGQSLLGQPGLLGYVLAGAQCRWPFKLTPEVSAAAFAIRARINGEPIRQELRLETGAR